MKLLLPLVCLLLLAPTAAASTRLKAPEQPTFPYRYWVREARIPTPDTWVRVIEGRCPYSDHALACVEGPRVYMNTEALAQRPEVDPRFVFYHELGHVFDTFHLDGRDRRRIRKLLHSPSPERLADSYASCAEGQGGPVCEVFRCAYRMRPA